MRWIRWQPHGCGAQVRACRPRGPNGCGADGADAKERRLVPAARIAGLQNPLGGRRRGLLYLQEQLTCVPNQFSNVRAFCNSLASVATMLKRILIAVPAEISQTLVERGCWSSSRACQPASSAPERTLLEPPAWGARPQGQAAAAAVCGDEV